MPKILSPTKEREEERVCEGESEEEGSELMLE